MSAQLTVNRPRRSPFRRSCEPLIEMARERVAVRLRERWWTSADVAASAHGVHEIAHGEYASNGVRGVAFTTRIERFPAFRDDLRGERNIRRNDQIARYRTLDDLVVRHIEAGSHLQHAQARHPRNGEMPIGDQRHGDTGAVRCPEEDFFDDVRTGIRVDPNAGSRHACTISRLGFETTIYAAARLRWRISREARWHYALAREGGAELDPQTAGGASDPQARSVNSSWTGPLFFLVWVKSRRSPCERSHIRP
jgi:hypothetical protein